MMNKKAEPLMGPAFPLLSLNIVYPVRNNAPLECLTGFTLTGKCPAPPLVGGKGHNIR